MQHVVSLAGEHAVRRDAQTVLVVNDKHRAGVLVLDGRYRDQPTHSW
jgi:hypothetical protein